MLYLEMALADACSPLVYLLIAYSVVAYILKRVMLPFFPWKNIYIDFIYSNSFWPPSFKNNYITGHSCGHSRSGPHIKSYLYHGTSLEYIWSK